MMNTRCWQDRRRTHGCEGEGKGGAGGGREGGGRWVRVLAMWGIHQPTGAVIDPSGQAHVDILPSCRTIWSFLSSLLYSNGSPLTNKLFFLPRDEKTTTQRRLIKQRKAITNRASHQRLYGPRKWQTHCKSGCQNKIGKEGHTALSMPFGDPINVFRFENWTELLHVQIRNHKDTSFRRSTHYTSDSLTFSEQNIYELSVYKRLVPFLSVRGRLK